MGVKIKKAWNTALKKEIVISNATETMRKLKQFCCNSPGCSAKLTWATRHKKNFNLTTKFYRLLPSETHSLNCIYNTEGQVVLIAKKSNKRILENISKGKYEFRINLVFEKEGVEKSKLSKEEKTLKDGNEILKDKKIIGKGNKSPYLSTMVDIMKLRSEVEENKDLSSFIRLKFKGNVVSWNNFYFELQEEEICYNYIKANGINIRNERKILSHLICTEFVLKRDGISKYDETYSIISTAKFVNPNSNNESHIHKILLKTKELKVIDKIESLFTDKTQKIKLVAFYKPSILNKPKSYKKNETDVFLYYINGWINNEEQVLKI